MASIVMRHIGGGLFPADATGADLLRHLPPRMPVAVRIMRGRSAVQCALYWSVLEKVVEATGRWRTSQELHLALKVATGHIDIVRLVDGRMVKVPQSTAFDAMTQDEAQAYYDAAFRVICDEVMGGMPVEELLSQTGAKIAA